MRKTLLFGFLWMLVSTSCLAQGRTPKKKDPSSKKTIVLADAVYRDAIRSVQLFAKANEFLTPAIAFGTDEKLTLKFDDLSGGFTTYSYTFMHCNANWEQSSIFENQFMDGFFQNEIRDYKYAVNTRQNYTSYSLDFPNSYIRFTASGNYVLLVYENGNKNKPVLTRRFYVYEPLASVESEVRRSFTAGTIQTNQSLDLKVTPAPSLKVFNPLSEFLLSVQQNRRWDQAVADIQPNLIDQKTLLYTFNDKLNFPAMNEFRQFDTRSLGINSLNVRKFLVDTANQIFLYDDASRASQPYNNYFDINGGFACVQRDGLITSRDPDYAYVHFTLNTQGRVPEGDVYLMGAFTNWQADSSNQLEYNEGCACYHKTLYLKQGYFNYMYAIKKNQAALLDFSSLEGSFQGTDNEYNIFVYFRSQIGLYDRLIGFQTLYSNGNH